MAGELHSQDIAAAVGVGLGLEVRRDETTDPGGALHAIDHLVDAELLTGDVGHSAALAQKDDLRGLMIVAVHADNVVDIVAIEAAGGSDEDVI